MKKILFLCTFISVLSIYNSKAQRLNGDAVIASPNLKFGKDPNTGEYLGLIKFTVIIAPKWNGMSAWGAMRVTHYTDKNNKKTQLKYYGTGAYDGIPEAYKAYDGEKISDTQHEYLVWIPADQVTEMEHWYELKWETDALVTATGGYKDGGVFPSLKLRTFEYTVPLRWTNAMMK